MRVNSTSMPLCEKGKFLLELLYSFAVWEPNLRGNALSGLVTGSIGHSFQEFAVEGDVVGDPPHQSPPDQATYCHDSQWQAQGINNDIPPVNIGVWFLTDGDSGKLDVGDGAAADRRYEGIPGPVGQGILADDVGAGEPGNDHATLEIETPRIVVSVFLVSLVHQR